MRVASQLRYQHMLSVGRHQNLMRIVAKFHRLLLRDFFARTSIRIDPVRPERARPGECHQNVRARTIDRDVDGSTWKWSLLSNHFHLS